MRKGHDMKGLAELHYEAEVAVVGGGPAGAIAALTLARAGHDVLLIDKDHFPRDKACGDVVWHTAVAFLESLGLDHVLESAYRIDGVRLFVDWKACETKRWRLQRRTSQACCLPRRHFDNALLIAAQDAGVRIMRATVTELIWRDASVAGVAIRMDGAGGHVRTPHVIAADGATSRLRRQLTNGKRECAPRCVGMRSYVRTERSLERMFNAYVPIPECLPGYGWLFPVSEHLANVGVGYGVPAGIGSLRTLANYFAWFLASLEKRYQCDVGNIELTDRPRGALLGIGFSAERCELGGVLLAGDAARTCDPLIGEGIDGAMRSGHAAALALHRRIKGKGRGRDVGRAIGRSNPRLEQNSSMSARVAYRLLREHEQEGYASLADRGKRAPVLAGILAMIVADVGGPELCRTPAGALLKPPNLRKWLRDVDELVRDRTRTDFGVVQEMLLRDMCGGLGPIGAVVVAGSHVACGAQVSEEASEGAFAVELLRTVPKWLGRMVPLSGTSAAKTNNQLATMGGEFGLAHACLAASRLGPMYCTLLADAITASGEAVALRARDLFNVQSEARQYLLRASLQSGVALALAARMGALLAGADAEAVEALAWVGENLGIAVQACEDILALMREDPVTGRLPRRILEEGEFTLPVIYALEDDPGLAGRLVGAKDGAEWDALAGVIRQSAGMARAVAVCEEHAARAREKVIQAFGKECELAVVCDLPMECLEPLTAKRGSVGAKARWSEIGGLEEAA